MVSKPTGPTRIGLWAIDLTFPVHDRGEWLSLLDRQMMVAKGQGAAALLLPEYCSAHWLNWAGDLTARDGLIFMAQEGQRMLPGLQALADKNDMALFVGSFPAMPDNKKKPVNRFHAIFPDHPMVTYDKLVLTPSERNPMGWNLKVGNRLCRFEWRGVKFVPLICLDVEMPAIAAELQKTEFDVLLVPSMTERISGYSRVFSCARARATELYCFVAVVGCIGDLKEKGGVGANYSAAAFFAPADMVFGGTGILAACAPSGQKGVDPAGSLIVESLDVALLRAERKKGGEVWSSLSQVDTLDYDFQ